MQKYYICSGDVNTVILGKDHMDAAVRALSRIRDSKGTPSLGTLVGISQHTFNIDEYSDADCFVLTAVVLQRAGLCKLYNIPDLVEDE